METSVGITCPLCSRNIGMDFSRAVHRSLDDGTEYKLYLCGSCLIEFWHPMKLMPEFYEHARLGIYDDIHQGLKRIPPHCLNFFEHMPFTAGNLLDVGCGDGVFLSAVTAGDKYRFDAFGLDFDPKSVEAARSRRGLTHVYALSLEEFHDHSARNSLFFDVITFFDVLEHQDNPKSFIETVKALLSPKGGYIAGSVPNAHRLFSRYDRKMSEIDFPPHHFLYFNGSSLAGLLRREGFRDIRVLPVRLGFSDLTVLLERMCLGRISGLLRRKITGVRPAAQEGETENPAAVYCGGTIKIMKQLRNAFFAPLAAALFHAYNRRGPQLYFQARLPARQGV